jgi:hypothetical protein
VRGSEVVLRLGVDIERCSVALRRRAHLRPDSLCSAICLDLLEKAEVLEYYETSVRSARQLE